MYFFRLGIFINKTIVELDLFREELIVNAMSHVSLFYNSFSTSRNDILNNADCSRLNMRRLFRVSDFSLQFARGTRLATS
jgi:hypothetical protein